MAKPKHINLTEEGVVTEEALLAYAEGRLSAAETAQMDKLLDADPFTKEALEGMRKSAAPGQIGTVVSAINIQLREKTGARERKKKGIEIHWAVYAYAAAIFTVLIGVGFVIIHVLADQSRQVAMNKDIPQGQESVPITEPKKKEEPKTDTAAAITDQYKDTTALVQSPNTAVTGTDESKPANGTTGGSMSASGGAINGAVSNTPAAAPVHSQSDDRAYKPAMAGEPTPIVTEKKAESKEAAPMTKNMTAMDNEKAAKPALSNRLSEADKTKTSNIDVTIALLTAAKSYFDSGDYANAEKKYTDILAIQPNNIDALYFGGVSSYLNGSRNLGEPNFDKLLKNGGYPEGSKWYKANILLRRGQKDEAKPLLHDLTNSSSSFRERAVNKYEELYGK